MLTFENLREANVKRCEESFFPLESWSLTDWACALAGEVGEVCGAVKKLKRGDGSEQAIVDEIGDVMVYADLLLARINMKLDDAIVNKFNRVSDRVKSDVKL